MNRISNFKFKISNLKLLMAVFLLFPAPAFSSTWQWVTPSKVYDAIKEGSGLWLVDIRGPMSFEQGHIEGSINIPANALAVKRFSKQRMITLLDDSLGLKRAREAAEILIKNGSEKIFIMDGGIMAWVEAGYPISGKGFKAATRKVTVSELKWAIENKIPVKIFDLRGKEEMKQGTIPGSEAVKGADMRQKIRSLKEQLTVTKKKGLPEKIKPAETSVLIFPAASDFENDFESFFGAVAADIRYLEGGYPAWNATRGKKTVGNCPVCPNEMKGKER